MGPNLTQAEGGTGIWYRSKGVYHSRTGHSIRNLYQLRIRSDLLGRRFVRLVVVEENTLSVVYWF